MDNLYDFSLTTYIRELGRKSTEVIVSGKKKTELGMRKVKKKGEGKQGKSLKVRKKYKDRIMQFY